MILSLIWNLLLKAADNLPDASKVHTRKFVINLIKCLPIMNEKYLYPPRMLLTRLLPWDPLSKYANSPMSIYILTTKKDIDVLPFSITSVLRNIANHESPITIVAPQKDFEAVQSLLATFQITEKVSVKSDESMLEEFDLNPQLFPNSHSFMQILKFLCVISSPLENAIVLDGDTIFLRKRTWVAPGKLVLVVPPEYERNHVRFVKEKFPRVIHSKLGFTTQAQVMKKSWIIELVNQAGGLDKFVLLITRTMSNYLKGGNLHLYPCEWQIMGDWVLTNKSKQVEFASYLNTSEVRSTILPNLNSGPSQEIVDACLNQLAIKYQGLASVSLHAHKTSK